MFATAARADEAQANQAVAAAKRAFGSWPKLGYAKRRVFLDKFANAIGARRDEFARLLTQENGKPLEQAKGEITGTLAVLHYFAARK